MALLRRSDLDGAVASGILSPMQADALTAHFANVAPSAAGDTAAENAAHAAPRFTLVHVLYYLGGTIAIGAMSLFMTLGWNSLGGWGGCVCAILYGMLALALCHWFLERKLEIPAGIMATLAVAMIPLAIFAAQMALGYWGANKPYRDFHHYIDWRWILMELGTLAIGSILLWRYRFPFMLMPISVTLWYMSMDLVPFMLQARGLPDYNWELGKLVSLWFGLAMTLLAFCVDLRSRFSRDYAFWLYLFGVLAFWGGLSSLDSGSEWGKLGYCAINVAMIFVGAVLGRRVFAVFGGFGVAAYLCDLSWRVFRDSLIFPFALSLVGLAIIALGVRWQRREAQWSASLRRFVPGTLRELIEARAVR
jgi:hypothetical protein